jgi:hypothetical protein
MLRMITAAAVMLAIGTVAAAAKPDKYERAALRKGYTGEKAKCYVEVSRRYYKPGTLNVSAKSAPLWKLELWQRCGVSR